MIDNETNRCHIGAMGFEPNFATTPISLSPSRLSRISLSIRQQRKVDLSWLSLDFPRKITFDLH